MSSLSFSLSDYQSGLAAGYYSPPDALCPYYEVDPVLFRKHGTTDQRRGDLRTALTELRRRTGPEYFGKTYPLQARTLDYSARSFPAYRFILPEVMTEDWLAIVDWGKFQRDHVLHQPLCGYIVLKLLEGGPTTGSLTLPGGRSLLDVCVDHILRWEETAYLKRFLVNCGMSERDPVLDGRTPVARRIWSVFFREAAYVAAIFHDLGYPWQYAERLLGNLDGMNAPAVRQNRSAAQVVDLFGHRLLFSILRGYRTPDAACPSGWRDKIIQLTDKTLMETHGLPGALGFLHLNDCIRRYPHASESPLHLLCVEWVAAAIMMHDMVKIYWGDGGSSAGVPENPFLRLGFDRDPLSAIITLADVIEDFERPAVAYGTSGRGRNRAVTWKYKKACSATELEIDRRGELTLRYRMETRSARARKRKNLKGESYQYFDMHYGYLDLSTLGVTGVKMEAA